jgi:anti-anti-sigma regulatory factor
VSLQLTWVVPGLARIDVTGDVDAGLAGEIGREIDAALAQGAEYVTLDLSGVGGADDALAGELGDAAGRAPADAIHVVVHGASPPVLAMLRERFDGRSPAVPIELVTRASAAT